MYYFHKHVPVNICFKISGSWWQKSDVCILISLSGILSSNSRVFPHPSQTQNGLLPRAHGPLHHAAGFTEGRHEETGLLPSSRGLLVALRRHHRVRFLLPGCRFVSTCFWLCFKIGEKSHLCIYWLIHRWCSSEVQSYLCNKQRYGYLNIPAKPHHTLEDDRLNFVHVQLESMSENRHTDYYVTPTAFIMLCWFSLLTCVLFLSNSWRSSNAPFTLRPYVPQTERPHGLWWGKRHTPLVIGEM